jgi:hypothetical protein
MENGVVRGIYVPKRQEVLEVWRTVRNLILFTKYYYGNQVKRTWAGHVGRTETRNALKIFRQTEGRPGRYHHNGTNATGFEEENGLIWFISEY